MADDSSNPPGRIIPLQYTANVPRSPGFTPIIHGVLRSFFLGRKWLALVPGLAMVVIGAVLERSTTEPRFGPVAMLSGCSVLTLFLGAFALLIFAWRDERRA